MFKEKKEEKKEEKSEFKNWLDEQVQCEECKCWLKESDAQKVLINYFKVFYCQVHKKPYQKVFTNLINRSGIAYFGEVEVDVNGKPIKNKK